MLTGYFLIYNDKINLKKIVCESVYYGLFATLLFIISYALGYRFDDISSLISLLKYVVGDAILPISKGNWWFVTAYVLIVLLHPLINKLFMKLNENCPLESRNYGQIIRETTAGNNRLMFK